MVDGRMMLRRRNRGAGLKQEERSFDVSAVKTLRKALELLRTVGSSDTPLSIAAAAAASGISRPTAYRMVQTLIAEGFLEQNRTSGVLSVGLGVLPLAAAHLDTNRLRVEALPHLHALAQQIGERVNLGIVYRGQVLYLAGVEKPTMPLIYSRFGKTTPIHCCSIGKVILANLPADAAAALIPAHLEKQTENTIDNLLDLRADLEATAKRGYAMDKEEHQRGTFCVAAPVFDSNRDVIGGISVSGRDLEAILGKVDQIRHTAEVISHYM